MGEPDVHPPPEPAQRNVGTGPIPAREQQPHDDSALSGWIVQRRDDGGYIAARRGNLSRLYLDLGCKLILRAPDHAELEVLARAERFKLSMIKAAADLGRHVSQPSWREE